MDTIQLKPNKHLEVIFNSPIHKLSKDKAITDPPYPLLAYYYQWIKSNGVKNKTDSINQNKQILKEFIYLCEHNLLFFLTVTGRFDIIRKMFSSNTLKRKKRFSIRLFHKKYLKKPFAQRFNPLQTKKQEPQALPIWVLDDWKKYAHGLFNSEETPKLLVDLVIPNISPQGFRLFLKEIQMFNEGIKNKNNPIPELRLKAALDKEMEHHSAPQEHLVELEGSQVVIAQNNAFKSEFKAIKENHGAIATDDFSLFETLKGAKLDLTKDLSDGTNPKKLLTNTNPRLTRWFELEPQKSTIELRDLESRRVLSEQNHKINQITITQRATDARGERLRQVTECLSRGTYNFF